MVVKFLDLQRQYQSLKKEIDSAIKHVLDSSSFIGGAEVQKFEESFGAFVGSYALGVGNGTDALEIAIEALNLPEGSDVLVPANTFAASAEAVVRNRLKIVFVDCDETYTMDTNDLRRKISPNTAAIMAVHLYGQPANMFEIVKLAQSHNLRLIEDCAQAHGAKCNGQMVGTFGDIATFSFYPGKNLGAFGDAGAIVCSDAALLAACRQIAHHGGLRKYEHHQIGRNSRLDALQAAVLNVKLRYLDEWNTARNKIAADYMNLLKGIDGLVLPIIREECISVWHLFVVRILENKRDSIKAFLSNQGIQTGLHYPQALPSHDVYQNPRFVRQSPTPNAIAWESEILSLPMGEHLNDQALAYISRAIRDYYHL